MSDMLFTTSAPADCLLPAVWSASVVSVKTNAGQKKRQEKVTERTVPLSVLHTS